MMKPVSDQPPLPQPPREPSPVSIYRWTSDITRQLVTYLREIAFRLNRTFTTDDEILSGISDGSIPSGGDVVGPAGINPVGSGELVVFDGTSGKLLKGAGSSISGLSNLELGEDATGDRNTFIDFHSSDAQDFSARIIRGPGENGVFNLSNTGSGKFNITNGPGTITLASGGGIELSGTFINLAPSGVLQYKGDTFYTEGSWTPQLKGSISDPVATFGGNSYFVRIGSLILFTIGINLTSYTPGTGTLRIGGLPYPMKALGNGSGDMSFSYITCNGTRPADFVSVQGGVGITGTTNMRVIYSGSGGGCNDLPTDAINTNAWIIGAGQYFI